MVNDNQGWAWAAWGLLMDVSRKGHFHLLKPSYCLGPGQRWQRVSSCFLPLACLGSWSSTGNMFGVLRTALTVPHGWGMDRWYYRAEWCSCNCGGWTRWSQMPSHPVLGDLLCFGHLLWPESWGVDLCAALMWQRGPWLCKVPLPA